MEQLSLVIKNLADCPEHLSTVSKWMWEYWNKDSGRSVEDVEYRTKHCLSKTDIPMTFIAFHNEKPVGTFSLWRCDLKTRQDLFPWFAVLYVISSMRKKGIGTQLQQFALAKTKELGYKSIYLITDLVNHYEKVGWKFLELAPLSDGKKTRVYEYKL